MMLLFTLWLSPALLLVLAYAVRVLRQRWRRLASHRVPRELLLWQRERPARDVDLRDLRPGIAPGLYDTDALRPN